MAAASLPQIRSISGNLTLIAFVALVIVGGGASVAIRYTYAELPVYWGATARFLVAALIFWGLAWGKGIALPRGRALVGAALFGALSVGASFIFIYYGLTQLPASLYQVVVALAPLLTLIFAAGHGLEKLQGRGLMGASLAVIGIVVIFGGSVSGTVSLPHLLAVIAGTACLAEAGIVAKRFPRSHPIATNAVAMTVGAVMLGATSLINGEAWVLPATTATWLAFAYIVVGASVIAFLLYVFVLGRWTASAASYAFVLFPLVTVIVATQMAGEQITWGFIGGGLLVLGGVWFGALRQS
ncbi:MAG: EamA family transporter [Anaerolineae bacterium]|nr:EamA family transporter [Anaerolineae bacterium]